MQETDGSSTRKNSLSEKYSDEAYLTAVERGDMEAAQVLKETMDSLDEIERLFTEAVQEAGERTRTAGVAVNRRSIQRLLCLRLTR